jgi:predicted nucleotidyltransferase component of viral defense system
LTPELASQWAASAQYRFVDALMADPQIQYEQIAFHGGTSLHFSWQSPRLSEDLDFLIARSGSDIHAIVERAGQKVSEAFRSDDPQFTVEAREKRRQDERMISYDLRVSHTTFLGKALIKVEFWRVSSEYLAQYPVELRSPIRPGEMVSRISNPIPAATLETAFCDKLTALATRPYLKWRDLYDLWWIGTQTEAKLDISSVAHQFLHNVSAYRTIDNLSPPQALRKFLEYDPAELVKKADPDLRRWLPQALWEKMHPYVTADMVKYVRDSLRSVADTIDENPTEGSNLKRVRP